MKRKLLYLENLESKEMLSVDLLNWTTGDEFLQAQRTFGSIATTAQNVTNGTWSNPLTWGGQIPQAGQSINIVAGTTVNYDLEIGNFKDINVYGRLVIKDQTSLRADNLYIHGQLRIGYEGFGTTTKIVLGRDFIAYKNSEVKIYGEDTTPFVKSNPASKGDVIITLSSSVTNWKVGDEIVITAADYRKFKYVGTAQTWQGSDDEIRTIAAIDNQRITLNSPLEYNHWVAGEDTPIYVANLTRSVSFTSRDLSDRAHGMYMTTNVIVQGASFNDMGRTDKSIPISENNPIGRYPVHVHKTGPANGSLLFANNVVKNSPGWGFVNHDANVNFIENVSYNVLGSHFVTERGTEAGSFINNIAIVAPGANDARGYKDGRDELLETGDFGHQGHGFWLQSRNTVVEGNIAVSTANSAFIWFHRSNEVLVPVNVSTLLIDHDEITFGRDTIDSDHVPLSNIVNNTAVASQRGLHVVKSRADQHHDIRSMIRGFRAYNVLGGIWLEYTSKYTLQDIYLDADDETSNLNDDWAVKLASNTQQVTIDNLFAKDFINGIQVSEQFVALGIDDTADLLAIDVVMENIGREFLWKNWKDHTETTVKDPFLHQYITSDQLNNNADLSWTIDPNQSFSLTDNKGQLLNGGWLIAIRGIKHDSAGDGILRIMFQKEDIKNLARNLGHYILNGKKYVIMIGTVADRVNPDIVKHITISLDATNEPNMLSGPILSFEDLELAHKTFLNLN